MIKLLRCAALITFLFLTMINQAQTVVTIGGGASGTCPFTPTATWTTPPTGCSFSNWSRGSGVTCSSAAAGLNGSGFTATSANQAYTNNEYYSVTISASAGYTVILNGITWATSVSSGTANFDIQYSNNGGAVSSFGASGTSQSSNSYTGTVTIAGGTSCVLYFLPWNLASSSSTVRLQNGSTVTVTTIAPFGASPWTVPATGTYNIPAGVNSFTVQCWGGGGGGGGVGGNGAAVGGGGGGGGAFATTTNYALSGGTIVVTIGTAGSAGTATSSTSATSGGPGGNSSVIYNSATVCLAAGGAAGTGVLRAAPWPGATVVPQRIVPVTTTNAGASGGNGYVAGASDLDGGGGGGAGGTSGTATAGGTGSGNGSSTPAGGTGATGGGNGANGSVCSISSYAAGSNGFSPGGGGSGGATKKSDYGAGGQVQQVRLL